MRWFALFLTFVFVITFAAGMGTRVSLEGRAFAFGLACGAAASIPASLLAFMMTRRSQPSDPSEQAGPYSPLVIVTNPVAQRPAPPVYPQQVGRPPVQEPRSRYKVVGEE